MLDQDVIRRISIRIRAKDGKPALLYNPKPWVTPMQAARLAQLLPMLFTVNSRDLPWHSIIEELGVHGHFDVDHVAMEEAKPKPEGDIIADGDVEPKAAQ